MMKFLILAFAALPWTHLISATPIDSTHLNTFALVQHPPVVHAAASASASASAAEQPAVEAANTAASDLYKLENVSISFESLPVTATEETELNQLSRGGFTTSNAAAMAGSSWSGFTLCQSSAPNHLLNLKSLSYSPMPVQAGRPLNIYFQGALSGAVVRGAYIYITAYLGAIEVLDQKIDFCSAKGIRCPVAASGNAKFSVSFNIPASAPSVFVSLNARIMNGDGREVVCVKNPSFQI